MNTKIENLHHNLIELLNTSELPIGVAYYVYKDVLIELEKIYTQALQRELDEQNKEE